MKYQNQRTLARFDVRFAVKKGGQPFRPEIVPAEDSRQVAFAARRSPRDRN
ncbi:hypothetical protein ACFL2H_00125 [Planctomycetota bacterium]